MTEDPKCQHCGVEIRPGSNVYAINDPRFYETQWVHVPGYRWCFPQESGMTTRAEPDWVDDPHLSFDDLVARAETLDEA